MSMMRVVVGALLVTSTPAVAGPGQPQLQRDLDALRDLGITGALARLETSDGVQTARSRVAELDTVRPVPVDPFLRAGSVTKTFVATVVLQLAAEGRLSLSDPVERWLRWRVARPDELIALAMRHSPADQVWAYSNTNYVLAGMVIKSVTGRDWTTEVRERIIAPLRLRRTTTPGTWPFLPRPRAHNYQQWTPGGPLVDTTIAVRALDSGADGSIVSTAEDLNTFITALVGGRLLPAPQLADMQSLVDIPPDPRGHTGYGLGLYYHPLQWLLDPRRQRARLQRRGDSH